MAGTLVIQVQFVVLAVLAAVFLGERLTGLRLLGIICVAAGIAALVLASGEAEHLRARNWGWAVSLC